MRDNGFNGLGLKAYPTTVAAEMAAYDALPPMVRARLRDAPVKVATGPIIQFWRCGPGEALERHDAILQTLDHAFSRVAA
ncbi:DUF6525 family protein [Brevundimonas nasdae]|uniref:DUF6525 family protein n=1 Tax=Brevundimonas nasdae TaxID=172043 RepID=UPI003F69121F